MKKDVLLCSHCQQPVKGRSDKKFCSPSCKNVAYQSERLANFKETELVLHQNYATLLRLLGSYREVVVEEIVLEPLRFQWEYMTRLFRNTKGDEYFVLYNAAWMRLPDGCIKIILRSGA